MDISGKRIKWVDSLKGFAIICVVLGHVVKGYLDRNMFPNNRIAMHNICNVVYSFHMPLFFMLSGFLFARAYCTGSSPKCLLKKNSYKNQIFNLILLYIVYDVLFGFSKMIFAGYVENKVTFIDILMIWAKPIQLFWYLYVLIVLYAVFALKKIRNADFYYILPLLFGCAFLSNFMFKTSFFQINSILYYELFFYLGIHLEEILENNVCEKFGWILTIIAVVTIIVFWKDDRFLSQIPIVKLIVALGISLMLIKAFRGLEGLGSLRPLELCGKYCLEIYLLHTFAATANRILLPKTGVNGCIANIVINSVLSLCIPVFFAVATKKFKIYNLLFKPYTFLRGMGNGRIHGNNKIEER